MVSRGSRVHIYIYIYRRPRQNPIKISSSALGSGGSDDKEEDFWKNRVFTIYVVYLYYTRGQCACPSQIRLRYERVLMTLYDI